VSTPLRFYVDICGPEFPQVFDCEREWFSEVTITRIENPRVGGSIPTPGTIKNSDEIRLVRVLLFLVTGWRRPELWPWLVS